MKKIIYCLSFISFTIALQAQTLQKPSNLPPPGTAPLTTPKLKELPDLIISCSDGSLFGGEPYTDRFGRSAIGNYKIRVTITITNQGQLPCSKGFELSGYVAPNPSGLKSMPAPRVADLNDRGSTTGASWTFGGCQQRNQLPSGQWDRPCFNMVADLIAPGASISREFIFDLGSPAFVGKGSNFFFTVLVDYTKRILEGNEDNNVSVPITINNSLD